jgi:hypothetical protein
VPECKKEFWVAVVIWNRSGIKATNSLRRIRNAVYDTQWLRPLLYLLIGLRTNVFAAIKIRLSRMFGGKQSTAQITALRSRPCDDVCVSGSILGLEVRHILTSFKQNTLVSIYCHPYISFFSSLLYLSRTTSKHFALLHDTIFSSR